MLHFRFILIAITILFFCTSVYSQNKNDGNAKESSHYFNDTQSKRILISSEKIAEVIKRGYPLKPEEIEKLEVVDICSSNTYNKVQLKEPLPFYRQFPTLKVLPETFQIATTEYAVLCWPCGYFEKCDDVYDEPDCIDGFWLTDMCCIRL